MDIKDSNAIEWWHGSPHRELGGIAFRDIFWGSDDQPDNYVFTLVRADDFFTPAHRHNFDQVRFMIEGEFGYGEGVQQAGSIGYFTEGMPYTQDARTPSLTLLLQCEGGDHAPFLSRDAVAAAVAGLKPLGTFQGGHFWPNDGEGKTKQDGFEALYEHFTGQPVKYRDPRFPHPVIMYPDRFAYVPHRRQAGLSVKSLSSFTERELDISFVKIDAGATVTLEPSAQVTLLYVTSGQGSVEQDGEISEIGPAFGVRLMKNETAQFTAETELEAFRLLLPA